MAITDRALVAGPRPPKPEPAHRPVARKVTDALLTLVAGLLFVVGYSLGVVLYPFWYGLLWLFAAVNTGWSDGSAVWRDK